jgi:hypothetical protein
MEQDGGFVELKDNSAQVRHRGDFVERSKIGLKGKQETV